MTLSNRYGNVTLRPLTRPVREVRPTVVGEVWADIVRDVQRETGLSLGEVQRTVGRGHAVSPQLSKALALYHTYAIAAGRTIEELSRVIRKDAGVIRRAARKATKICGDFTYPLPTKKARKR